jgi:DNA-binding MarR family transcriptional regulator
MARGGTEKGDDASALGLWLRLLSCTNIVSRDLRRRLKEEFATTLPRFDLMAQVAREPTGPSLGELSRRLLVSKGNITDLVMRLEKDKLVERRRDTEDGRVQHVYLTPEGEALLAKMLSSHNRWLEEITSRLDQEEMKALYQSLGLLKTALRRAESALTGADDTAEAAE